MKTEVYTQLAAVRVLRLQQTATDKEWAKLKEQSTRLLTLYKSNAKIQEQVYAARLIEAMGLYHPVATQISGGELDQADTRHGAPVQPKGGH